MNNTKQFQQATKKYFGVRVNITSYAYVIARRCEKNAQTVYNIMQLTNCSERQVMRNVQEGVISFEQTQEFAAVCRRLPTLDEGTEMYLLGGFENWYKLNQKA